MTRITWTQVRIVLGMALLTAAFALLVHGVLGGDAILEGPVIRAAAMLIAIAGLIVAAWRLRMRPAAEDDEGGSEAPIRRAARYRLVESAPERAAFDHPLAGGDGSALLARASEAAREAGRAEAGVELVRPALRGLLEDVLVAGGYSEAAADRAIDEGTWTDDATAVAVLSAEVDPPSRPLRERMRAWLVPDRVVREHLDRTIAAMAATAERTLLPVPGQRAPRRVTVEPPTLAELRRDVDGSLRRAVHGDGESPSLPRRYWDEGLTEGEPAGDVAGEGER